MNMKPSLYNIFLENKNNELLLVNTRTLKRVKFSVDDKGKIKELLSTRQADCSEDSRMKAFLFKNEFFLPEDYDECRWIELKYNQMAYDTSFLDVTIMPTVNCNFRCVYCYETPERSHMTEETIERVKRFFNKKIPGCKQVKVSWFGGEPLLYKETVIELMEHIDKVCKKYGAVLVGSMNTNGYLLDIDTFRKLVSLRVRSYEICVDGSREVHNKQRPHQDDKDSYKRIIENLLNIKNGIKTHTFTISIRANITRDVESVLESHIKQIAELFSCDNRFYISFQGVRDWGGERIDTSMVLGTKNEKQVHKSWHSVAHDNDLQSIEALPIFPFAGYCGAGKSNGYVINYDGSLHKCTIAMYDSKYKDVDAIGEIDEYGNPKVDEEKLAQWTVRPTAIREKCKTCPLFPLCFDGSCAYQRNVQGNYRCNPVREMFEAQTIRFDELGRIPCFEDGQIDNRMEG